MRGTETRRYGIVVTDVLMARAARELLELCSGTLSAVQGAAPLSCKSPNCSRHWDQIDPQSDKQFNSIQFNSIQSLAYDTIENDGGFPFILGSL